MTEPIIKLSTNKKYTEEAKEAGWEV